MIPARHGKALSDRELQVLTLLAAGMSNREIGQALFLSPDTIKSHLRNIYSKLGARNGRHAIALTHDLRVTWAVSGR